MGYALDVGLGRGNARAINLIKPQLTVSIWGWLSGWQVQLQPKSREGESDNGGTVQQVRC